MTPTEWTALIVALSGLGTAISTTISKGRWSKEFSTAKDETIRAKEAEIALLREQLEMLREFLSPKAREYFIQTKTTLEEFIETLHAQLEDAHRRVEASSA